MADPMTPERLAEIRDLCVDSTSANAPFNPDVWALEQARLDLLAELDRRDKAANGEGMSGDRLAELRALLAEWKAPGFAHELLAEVERLREEERHQRETAKAATSGWKKAAAQVRRVRELHKPDKNGECTACDESFDPCSTIRALDGEGEASEKSGADVLLDHLKECHPDVKGLVASQAGPLDDEVAELERQGWTIERVEYVAGKRLRIMRPPAEQDGDDRG